MIVLDDDLPRISRQSPSVESNKTTVSTIEYIDRNEWIRPLDDFADSGLQDKARFDPDRTCIPDRLRDFIEANNRP